MYGFSVSKLGILTDNYFKKKEYTEDPEPQGAYILIKKMKQKLKSIKIILEAFGYIFMKIKIKIILL